MLVGHRLVAIFRTAIWLLSGETGSSSLGDLFCRRYGDSTESVLVRSRTPSVTPRLCIGACVEVIPGARSIPCHIRILNL